MCCGCSGSPELKAESHLYVVFYHQHLWGEFAPVCVTDGALTLVVVEVGWYQYQTVPFFRTLLPVE